MPRVITAISQAIQPGIYFLPVPQPNIVSGVSLGRIGIAMQCDWGPVNTLVKPGGSEFLQRYHPKGSARTSTGWLLTTNRYKPVYSVVRVLHNDALQATCTAVGAYGNIDAVAKYPGTMPNAARMTLTVAAAGGGDANKRKVTITLTDTVTGQTAETYDNLAAGATPVVNGFRTDNGVESFLLASLAVWSGLTSWPANGVYNFTGGSNGSAVTSADYDSAFAVLDSDDDVVAFGADDCGDSLRDAVNSSGITHSQNKADGRWFGATSKQSAGWATVLSEVQSLRDKSVRFCTWVKTLDVNAVEQLTPLWTFVATVNVNEEPQNPAAWKTQNWDKYYQGISSIPNNANGNSFDTTDATAGGIREQATTNGVCLPVRKKSGAYSILHDRTTSVAVSERFVSTQLCIRYIDNLLADLLAEYESGPLTADQRRQAKVTCDGALNKEGGKRIAIADDTTTSQYPQFKIGAPMFQTTITGFNDATTEAQGLFQLKLDGVVPSVMERLVIIRNLGTAPTIPQ